MSWVGVRYRGIALPDIMKVMRLWLDQRKYQPKAFDYVISGTGTLVRMEFEQEAPRLVPLPSRLPGGFHAIVHPQMAMARPRQNGHLMVVMPSRLPPR